MKSSKKLAIILGVVALMAYSWYAILDNGKKQQMEYDGYLKAARENVERGVVSEAVKNFDKALDMYDSMDIRLEKAECYLVDSDIEGYIATCNSAIEFEPFNVRPYEMLMKYYFDNEDFTSCYDMYLETMNKNIASDSIMDYYEQMKYEYKFVFNSYTNISEYRNGYAITLTKDGTYSYVDRLANKVFNLRFEKATPFTGGFASAIDKDGEAMVINENGIKTYVDAAQREITDVKSYVSKGFAIQVDGKYTYVDLQFNDIGGSYDDAGAFINGYAAVKNDGKWYVIDESLNKVSSDFDDIKIDFVDVAFRMQRGFAKQGDSYYLITPQGEKIGDGVYEDADVFFDEYAAVKINGKWGFIDTEGNIFIEPKYDEAKTFSYGYAAVCMGDEWFYIDTQGNKCIEGDFEDACDMTDRGTAFVRVNDEWRLLQLYSFGY